MSNNKKFSIINGKICLNPLNPLNQNIINSSEESSIATSSTISTASQINVIDLFCGCGGMSKGLTDAGLNIIAGIDIWDKAINSYKQNYHHTAICEDLTKLPPEKFNTLYNRDNKIVDLIVGGPPCFIAGTQVLTDTGYKKIEDIKLTDKLLTHTGVFQNICNLQTKTYTGNLYDIKIKYHGDTITCTEEHPFYVREKHKKWDASQKKYNIVFGEPKWKESKELTNNDYFGMVINTNSIIPEFTFNKVINQFSNQQFTIKLNDINYWYMMGYFIGDGWIEETCKKNKNKTFKYNIKFAINNKDENEVCDIIKKILPITEKKNDSGKCKKYGCSNYLWFNIFKMFGKYSHGKLIPEWVQDAPKEYIQEFINGYMKADGNIRKDNILNLTSVSVNLILGLQRLYLKLGYIFSITKTIRPKTTIICDRIVNQRDTYSIRGKTIKKRNVSSFIENNYVWFEPSKIKKRNILENMVIPVYNFEVETDNSYIVYNTIVHNCQGMSIAGKRDINDPRNSLFIEYVKYLDYFKPKAFIMENVIGILSMKTANNENVIDIIMDNLTKNYNCVICKLYASDFEVPQNRRRTIIIGIRKDLNIIPIEPKPVLTLENRKAVRTILLAKENIDNSYYLSTKALDGIKNKKAKAKANNNGFGAQFLDMNKPSYTIPARYWKDGYDALVKYSNTEIRRLTILELKRIQSFPDDYIIEGSKKDIIMQIGNAVACRFAYHLGKHILSTLHLE